jgi:hypothetical protein
VSILFRTTGINANLFRDIRNVMVIAAKNVGMIIIGIAGTIMREIMATTVIAAAITEYPQSVF